MKVARSRAKNRNRIGIIKEILSLLNESPQARTHIMYKANLAYPQACEYLNDLIAVSGMCFLRAFLSAFEAAMVYANGFT